MIYSDESKIHIEENTILIEKHCRLMFCDSDGSIRRCSFSCVDPQISFDSPVNLWVDAQNDI